MNKLIKLLLAMFVAMSALTLCGCSDEPDEPSSGGGGSKAKVEIAAITVGTKDKSGRYSVRIIVKAKGLAEGETVKTIGAKWGTVKNRPNSRDSRSGTKSATLSAVWHSGSTYYVTPFLKTSKTSGEITGETKSKKTP